MDARFITKSTRSCSTSSKAHALITCTSLFIMNRKARTQEERNEIAEQEIAKWLDYVEMRSKELPEKLKINPLMEKEMRFVWVRTTELEKKAIPLSKMLDLHYAVATKYKMRIPVDPKNLAQMIHPHYGYLISMPGEFEYEDLTTFYGYQLVSTMERLEGQSLLAEEISALSYWMILDKEAKGCLSLEKFVLLLKAFRENIKKGTLEEIKEEYKFLLTLNPGEFLKENNTHLRFDFARRIFLERCST
eukprot:TRINITY_DN12928_c0_g1_i12.p1 TRINITY_DN12928_c0_g1~~TRINITY_DN12928_c0_g1_i12.p1  ORF type:complete len:247 (-),score=63.98 TRINITY_DN12928_c0_g1_i12:123-863(-)